MATAMKVTAVATAADTDTTDTSRTGQGERNRPLSPHHATILTQTPFSWHDFT